MRCGRGRRGPTDRETSIDDGDAGRHGSPLDMLERRRFERAGTPEDPQVLPRDPIAEKDQTQGPVVLAGDPDQTIRFGTVGVERLRPEDSPRVVPGVRGDQLLARDPEAAQAESVELKKDQVAPRRQNREARGLQPFPPDDL